MMSRGSVIPLFIKQALAGDKLTITNPEMTRFMMSLDDSVELVMYAFKNGNPGDIFVQKVITCHFVKMNIYLSRGNLCMLLLMKQ
jgi:FlaA1/EpsC-like NDP-sugar epimerase